MKPRESPFAKGNLKALMATGGVLAGAGTASQAAIVYTDISDLNVSVGQNIYFSLTGQDADTTIAGVSGGPQLNLHFDGAPADAGSPIMAALGFDNDLAAIQGVFNPDPDYGFFANRLTAGSVISGATSFSPAGYGYGFLTYPDGVGFAQWAAGDRGYVGLRVNDGGAFYGWADVSYNANSSLTLYGFAYEGSGGQILAGAVPEPAATGAIAALFAGSVAAFELRRRRKSGQRITAQLHENSQERA